MSEAEKRIKVGGSGSGLKQPLTPNHQPWLLSFCCVVEQLAGCFHRALFIEGDRISNLARANLFASDLAGLAGDGFDQRTSAGLELARTTSGDQDVSIVAIEAF